MNFLSELKDFIKSMLSVIYIVLGIAMFLFSFGLKTVVIYGASYHLPLPYDHSFSVSMFNAIQRDLLPAGVHLVVTNPLSGFISQILLSLLLAGVIGFPICIYMVIRYLSPALFEHEKKAILQALLPSVGLFFCGCLFAYYLLVPLTFGILFPYATAIGATPFFSVDEFVSTVVSLVFVTGVMFLLPLFMFLLSYLRVVDPSVWRSKWRHALLFFLIFTAVVTPDGTGVTMMLLFCPLMTLYILGCALTWRVHKSKIDT